MPGIQVRNFVVAHLTAALPRGATQAQIDDPTRLPPIAPGEWFRATIETRVPGTLDANGNVLLPEAVKVTASRAGLLTIERGAEGSTARDHAEGDVLSGPWTKETFEEYSQKLIDASIAQTAGVDTQARADIGTLRNDLTDTDQEFYDLSEAALQELFEIQADATAVQLGTPGGRNNTVELQVPMVAGKFSVLRIGRGPTDYDPILIRNDDIKDAQWTTYEMRIDGTPTGRNAELSRAARDFPILAIDTAGSYERIRYGQLNPTSVTGSHPADVRGALLATSPTLSTNQAALSNSAAWDIESGYATRIVSRNSNGLVSLDIRKINSDGTKLELGEAVIGFWVVSYVDGAEKFEEFVPYHSPHPVSAQQEEHPVTVDGSGNVTQYVDVATSEDVSNTHITVGAFPTALPANTRVKVYIASISTRGGGGAGGGLDEAGVKALINPIAQTGNTERWGYGKLPADLQSMMGGGGDEGGGAVKGDLIATSVQLRGMAQNRPIANNRNNRWTIESDYADFTEIPGAHDGWLNLLALKSSDGDVLDWGDDFMGWIIEGEATPATGDAWTSQPLFIPAFYPRTDNAITFELPMRGSPPQSGSYDSGTMKISARARNDENSRLCIQLSSVTPNFGVGVFANTVDVVFKLYKAVIGAGGGGGGSGAQRTDAQIRSITDTQLDSTASTIAAKPAELDAYKDEATGKTWFQIKGGAIRSASIAGNTLTITKVDGTTSTLTLPGATPAHGSGSAGSIQDLASNADLNLIRTTGRYEFPHPAFAGTNQPQDVSGKFEFLCIANEGTAGASNGTIEQWVFPHDKLGQTFYYRSSPVGDGTSTDVPASITAAWAVQDNVAALPDFDGVTEAWLVLRQQGSREASRRDETFEFTAAGSDIYQGAVKAPFNSVVWHGPNPLRIADANVLRLGQPTDSLGTKVPAAIFADGQRRVVTTDDSGGNTFISITIPNLLAVGPPERLTADLNVEYTDGSYLYESGADRFAHPVKATFTAFKDALNIPPEGKLRGIGDKPDPASYEDGDGWLVPSTGTLPGFYEIVEGGSVSTSIEGNWAPARLSFEGIEYFGFNSVQPGDRISLPIFGARPAWMPTSIRALYTFGNSQVRMILSSDHGGTVHVVRGSVSYSLVDRGETTGVTGGYFLYAAFNVTPNWDATSMPFEVHTPENEGFQRTGKHFKLVFAVSADAFTAEDAATLARLAAIGNATPDTAGYQSAADKTKLDALETTPPGVNAIPANWQSGADPKAAVGSRVNLLDPDTFAIYRELRVAATTDSQGRAIRAWDTQPAIGSLEGVTAAIRNVVGIFAYPSNYAVAASRNKVFLLMAATNTPSPASIEIDGTAYTVQGSSTDQFREVNGLTYSSLVPGTVYRFNATDASGKFFPDLDLVPHYYVFDGRVPVQDAQTFTLADVDARIAEFAQRGQPNPHALIFDQTLALNATQAGVAHLNSPVQPNPTFSTSGGYVLQISVQWQTSTGTISIDPPFQPGFNQVTTAALRGRPAYEAVAALAGNVGVSIAQVEVRNASRAIATATLYAARTTGDVLTLFMRWHPGSNPDAGATGAVQAAVEIVASPLA